MKKHLSTIVKIGISAAILYAIFSNIDTGAFLRHVTSANPLSIIAAAIIFIITQCVSSYRWMTILGKDIEIPYKKVLSIYFIGMFFNNFLPTMVGGDVVKGYYIYRYTKRGDVSLASIFMDRYSGFTALMCMTAIAVILGYSLIAGSELPFFFVLLLGSFVGLSLVIWVGPLHGWAMSLMARVHFYGINKKIDTFYKVLMGYKGHPKILAKIFVASLIIQSGVIVGYYIMARGFGMDVPLAYYFLYLPLAAVVAMLPVSLSGLGLREGAFVFLFTKAGATTEEALTLSLMWFAMMVIVSLAGGVEYVRSGKAPAIAQNMEDRP